MEIAVLILEESHVTRGYIIWPLFILGALLIADWIFRGEWKQKHEKAAVSKWVLIYSIISVVFLSAIAIWLVHKIGYLEKHPEPESASNTINLPNPSAKIPQKPSPESPTPKKARKNPRTPVQNNKESNGANTQIGTAQGPVAIAPNGIAIGGGTVTNPTVNNFAPPSRTLSPDQKNALIDCLKTNPGKYTVGAIGGNREAYAYAQEWSEVFHAAGWTNEQPIPVVTFIVASGVWPAMQLALHGTYDSASKVVMVEGSPEKTATKCVIKIPTSKGGVIALQDTPTGSVRLDVSDREN